MLKWSTRHIRYFEYIYIIQFTRKHFRKKSYHGNFVFKYVILTDCLSLRETIAIPIHTPNKTFDKTFPLLVWILGIGIEHGFGEIWASQETRLQTFLHVRLMLSQWLTGNGVEVKLQRYIPWHWVLIVCGNHTYGRSRKSFFHSFDACG